MSARWWTFVVWALAAASALFWGMKLFVAAPRLPPRTSVAAPGPVARGDLSRLLGVDAPPPVVAAAAEPAPDARFQLIGVVSPRGSHVAREGLALIAIDGRPARAYRVGAVVEGQTVLQSVATRGAKLGPRDGAALVALSLAPPAAAATGNLPPAVNGDTVGGGNGGGNGGANGVRAQPQALPAPIVQNNPYQPPNPPPYQPPRRVLAPLANQGTPTQPVPVPGQNEETMSK